MPVQQPVQATAADQRAQTLTAREITAAFAPLLNAARAAQGLVALVPNATLERAALGHAQDMETRNFFAHDAPDGTTLADRARTVGYRYCSIAENIAQGQRTVREVHEAWMNSPGHRANNLLNGIDEFGIFLVDDTWVLVLGREGC